MFTRMLATIFLLASSLSAQTISIERATKQIDATRLIAVADSVGVPRAVMLGVSWQETRTGQSRNSARGPGRLVYDSATGVTRRICREVGRMQLNPCTDWRFLNPLCTLENIRTHYEFNILCGALYLRHLHDRFNLNWIDTFTRYNGTGPRAKKYRQEVLATIGLYALVVPELILR